MGLWTKSYDVTIQMKALCLYFHLMLFVSQDFRKKFGRNLPLATFGSERVKRVSVKRGLTVVGIVFDSFPFRAC